MEIIKLADLFAMPVAEDKTTAPDNLDPELQKKSKKPKGDCDDDDDDDDDEDEDECPCDKTELELELALRQAEVLFRAIDETELFVATVEKEGASELTKAIAQERLFVHVPKDLIMAQGGTKGFIEKGKAAGVKLISRIKQVIINVVTKFTGDSRVKQLRLETMKKLLNEGTHVARDTKLSRNMMSLVNPKGTGHVDAKTIAKIMEGVAGSVKNFDSAINEISKLDNESTTQDYLSVLSRLFPEVNTAAQSVMSMRFADKSGFQLNWVKGTGTKILAVNPPKDGKATFDDSLAIATADDIIAAFAAMPKVSRSLSRMGTNANADNMKAQVMLARIMGDVVKMYRKALNDGYKAVGGSIKKKAE